MAQNIKLKRSSVSGKVPTTSQLEAGEIAINTADGKLYFERDDTSIQTIVTTNAVITGSLNINGPITGSDVSINQWGSVSASLSSISSQAAVVPTLDQVTDQGTSTTNFIQVGSITTSTTGGFIAGVFKTTDGTNTVILESSGSGGANPGSTILQFRDSKLTQRNASITYGGNAADYLRLNTSAGTVFGITGSNANSTYVFGSGNNAGTGSFSWDLNTTFIQQTGGGTTQFLGNATSATSATSASFATTASFASTAPFAGITGKPTLVSSSVQIDLSQATGTAANAISASYALSASHAVTASYVVGSGIDGTVANANYAANTVVNIKNVSGAPIAKGTPLYITGSGNAGNLVGVWPADASNPLRMPAGVIAADAIAAGEEGIGLLNGFINEVNTSAFSSGDEIYVAAGGGYTNIVPTGSNILVQKLGNVERVGSVNGSGVINGPSTARSVPNIASGFTWVGNGNGVATPTAVSTLSVASAVSTSFASTASAVNILDQDVTIIGNLEVYGTASFTYTTASQLNIGEAFISVNVATPSQRFGGITVYDSGSVNVTASLAYDSLSNDWKFFHEDVSTSDYSILLFGPLGSDKENTPALQENWITKVDNEGHGHHITTSSIYDDGTVIKVGAATQITGSLTTTGKVIIGAVDNHGTDPDKFLAIVNGEVVYRTGAQILSDIGGQTSGTFVQNAGGGGVARSIMRYADSNSATTSSIFEDTSGRIGIRTITPAYPLDISGSFRATSNSNIVGFVKSTSAFGATISYQDPNTTGNDWVSAGAFGNSFFIATGLQAKVFVDVNGHTYPNSDKLQDFGSGSNRWRTIFTDDLDASDRVTAGSLDVKGNAVVSGSITIQGTTKVVQEGIFVTGLVSLNVASINTGSYEGAFLDYVLSNGSNKRAGTLTSVWTSANIEWKDVSTLDLGSTEGAEFTPILTGSNARIVLAVPGGDWTVRGHLRYM